MSTTEALATLGDLALRAEASATLTDLARANMHRASTEAASMGTAQVAALLTADVLARLSRASDAAARTYRASRHGFTAEEVHAEAVADMLSETAQGATVATDSASIGTRCRRIADSLRRQAQKESPAGLTPTDVHGAQGDGTKQATAVLARGARIGTDKRTDVLAVADYSRAMMRSAETVALARMDRDARTVAEYDYAPSRDAEASAWAMLAELANVVTVPAMGETDRHYGPSGRKVDTETVWEVSAGSAPTMPTRSERAAMRREIRHAERAVLAATVELSLAVELAELADASADALARVADAENGKREASAYVAALRLERDTRDRRGTAAWASPNRQPRTVAATVAASTSPLDALSAGYVAESLAERVSAKREASATVEGRFTPSRLADASGRRSEGRNWLLATPRHVSWSGVLPDSGTTTRRALQRATVGFAAHVLASSGESATVNAERAVTVAEVSEHLRDLAAEYATEYVPPAPTMPSAERLSAMADSLAASYAESRAEMAERAALADAYGNGWTVDAWWLNATRPNVNGTDLARLTGWQQ